MTGIQLLEGALWTACAAGLGALGLAVYPAQRPQLHSVRPVAGQTTRERVVPTDSLTSVVVSRDLFRRERRPAIDRYSLDVPLEADGSVSEVVRPVLALVGIVMGTEPTAIVEGFPGVEGARVVRAGERIGELHVRRIREGTVEIAGLDTVWVLRVREPWQ